MDSAKPLLVFSDDWGRHPSSCQHLIVRLLDRHEVYWVNTIGMRPPRLDLATMRRGWEKARQWIRPAGSRQTCSANPRVLNPRMWPWISSRFDRAVNRKLLLRQLRSFVPRSAELPTVVTTVPVVADIVDSFPAQRWVYYCVDDFSSWPGLDHSAIREMEEKLIAKSDVIIAVSATLQERLARMGRASHLLSHGVDIEHWLQSLKPCPLGLANSARPLVVFWGVIDRRMDTQFVRRLSERMSVGSIVLAGPLSDPDPALLQLPRVQALGAIPFEQLPALAAAASVLIMPYADLPVTRAIQPLKLKEYLATGRPVVVRDLPANREWADCLDLVANPDDFADAVTRRFQSGLPIEQRLARGRLHRESWEIKARTFESWIHNRQNEVATAC